MGGRGNMNCRGEERGKDEERNGRGRMQKRNWEEAEAKTDGRRRKRLQ